MWLKLVEHLPSKCNALSSKKKKKKQEEKLGVVVYICNPSTERLRQDCEFEANLSYIARPCLKKNQKNKRAGDVDQ
jgi:hypothetical protein